MMGAGERGYPEKLDLTNCEREPIHIPGHSQSHGVLLACDRKDRIITQCSENAAEIIGLPVEELLEKPLAVLLPEASLSLIASQGSDKFLLPELSINGKSFSVVAHRSGDHLVLDIEPTSGQQGPAIFQDQLSWILEQLNGVQSLEELCRRGTLLVKSIFRYDRVMLYTFDEQWNGKVVAEEKEPGMESWLGLHYPATDIPKPARELFLKQGVRMISDVQSSPALLIPERSPLDQQPLDLSRSELRGVSPVHIEYLKNMQVGASLTAAIVLKNNLWGLIACHHSSPKFTSYHQRQSLNFLTQIFINKLDVITTGDFKKNMEKSDAVRKQLVAHMASAEDLLMALTRRDLPFTRLIDCSGGAIYQDGALELTGITPSREEVLQLISACLSEREHPFYTHQLEKSYPAASAFKEKVSGVLSVRIGEDQRDLIMWFRSETSQNVSWGGKPQKNAVEKNGVMYLSPRKSFEKWTQRVSGTTVPWKDFELQAVLSLQENIVHAIVQRQRRKIRDLNTSLLALNKELESFSYNVSHDLRAPLRGITGYARILKEDHSQVLDTAGKKAVETILKSASVMDRLIDDLLTIAKLGKGEISRKPIDIQHMIREILQALNTERSYPRTRLYLSEGIPSLTGDPRLIYPLLSNLIGNAFKYSEHADNPEVRIGFESRNGTSLYVVKDNGIGFDPSLREKIFEVFKRLVGEQYTGSGIGLAIAKKVVDRHHGSIWAEALPGKGAAFYFNIPEPETIPEQHLKA